MSKVESNPGEKWKLIEWNSPPKEKIYFISNHGRAKSKSKNTEIERIIKTHPDHRGFYRASIKGGNDKNQALYVHKEVAIAFAKKSADDTYIIHKDINRNNNHHSNILWVTDAEWKEYVRARAKKFGFKRSTKGGYFKLTAAQVAIIKKQLLQGKTRRKMIAKRFGISTTQLSRIEKGENWSDVKPAK